MFVVVASFIGRKGQSGGGEEGGSCEARRSFHKTVFFTLFLTGFRSPNMFNCPERAFVVSG